jgi:hypothetical protein
MSGFDGGGGGGLNLDLSVPQGDEAQLLAGIPSRGADSSVADYGQPLSGGGGGGNADYAAAAGIMRASSAPPVSDNVSVCVYFYLLSFIVSKFRCA